MNIQFATFGGGCFWGVEEKLQRTHGVIDAVSGYAGGHGDNPTYSLVCTGTTAHAEVVQVEFDADIISYKNLLKSFMKQHDPTGRNYSNINGKSQYRSIVLFHNNEQKDTALKVFKEIEEATNKQIKTELSPLVKFTKAEDSHQDYYGYGRKAV